MLKNKFWFWLNIVLIFIATVVLFPIWIIYLVSKQIVNLIENWKVKIEKINVNEYQASRKRYDSNK